MFKPSRILTGLGLVVAAAGTASGVHAFAASGGTTPPPADPRDQAVFAWVGHGVVVGQWRDVVQHGLHRYQARVAGVGIVQVDARSNEVDEVVFEGNLGTRAGQRVAEATALGTASALAKQHYTGFELLDLRHTSRVDHGLISELRFEWQARRQDAWLPSRVTVGVNEATGQVFSYWSEREAVKAATVPQVRVDQARAAAVHLSGIANPDVTGPFLEVVSLADGSQRLVWITEVTQLFNGGVHIPNHQVLWTDAQTGSTEVAART
ncbi:MAG TPA: hypothetical protein VGQ42_16430 [Candidatus Dormibacteraeota bacterium]|jgi:hypothetical protein|nr:hypothetical protein [Candidatus Dormibacteraeota bacterium]